jgi:hypothetical protein
MSERRRAPERGVWRCRQHYREGSAKVIIGEELAPGFPETRRPEERRLGDAEAVAAELVVRAVRPWGGA